MRGRRTVRVVLSDAEYAALVHEADLRGITAAQLARQAVVSWPLVLSERFRAMPEILRRTHHTPQEPS